MQSTQSIHQSKSSMNLNLFLLLSAALFNAATATETTVDLGTAATYTILAQSGISTVPFSSITGNIGVSPIAATAITGFGLLLATDGQSATTTQVSGGKAFAASYGGATATALTLAVGDMGIAYADAAGRANNDPTRINVGQGRIGGSTLTPGVYTFRMGISIGTDLTFDAQLDPNAVFILQTTGNLLQAARTHVILINGAQSKNIFWQVAGNVLVGVKAHLAGVLLVKTDVKFMTFSSLNGRILAQTACTLQAATINQDTGAAPETTVSNERALATATATAEVIATTIDPFSGVTTKKTTIITQETIVTALETIRTTRTTHITTATSADDEPEVITIEDIDPPVVVESAGSGAAAPAATASAVAVAGRAPFLASATATATATASLTGSATATANSKSITGPASTATSTATTTATRTTTEATALSDATKTDSGILPTAASTTTGTTQATAEALASRTATSTATATFTEA
jgi:hypothetical protein